SHPRQVAVARTALERAVLPGDTDVSLARTPRSRAVADEVADRLRRAARPRRRARRRRRRRRFAREPFERTRPRANPDDDRRGAPRARLGLPRLRNLHTRGRAAPCEAVRPFLGSGARLSSPPYHRSPPPYVGLHRLGPEDLADRA